MKILTKKAQIRNKLKEIDQSLKILIKERNEAYERRDFKTNWRIISCNYRSKLIEDYEIKSTRVELLEEYRTIIYNMLSDDTHPISRAQLSKNVRNNFL